ncbi:MAG: lysophospholipid acyltransferase family protein [Myxococcota bacterium]
MSDTPGREKGANGAEPEAPSMPPTPGVAPSDLASAQGGGTFLSEGFDPREIEELRASVAALRSELAERFGAHARGGERGPEPEPEVAAGGKAEPAVGGSASRASAPRASPSFAGLDLGELWDSLRARLGNLGVHPQEVRIDDFGMEPAALAAARGLLDFLFDRWWRVRIRGQDWVPLEVDPPVLYVANRSGVLPYDGLMIAHALERLRPELPRARFLVADWLMTLPFAAARLARIGGVRACPENAERLLETGRPVIAFPEGQKGALKSYAHRYQLQRFGRGGYVSLAVRARAQLVPVAVVGAEDVHPILFRSGFLERLLGLPVPVTPTFPHLGPLGAIPFPSRWRIRFGPPVPFDRVSRERAEDPLYLNRTSEEIRATIARLLEEELAEGSG